MSKYFFGSLVLGILLTVFVFIGNTNAQCSGGSCSMGSSSYSAPMSYSGPAYSVYSNSSNVRYSSGPVRSFFRNKPVRRFFSNGPIRRLFSGRMCRSCM